MWHSWLVHQSEAPYPTMSTKKCLTEYIPMYHMPAPVSQPSSGAFSLYALKQMPSGAFYYTAVQTGLHFLF